MRTPIGAFIFILILLIIDFYVFQSVKAITLSATPRTRTIVYNSYWAVTILVISAFILFALTGPEFLSKSVRTYIFAIIIGLFLAKLVVLVFLLIDDIRRAVQWIILKIFYTGNSIDTSSESISRSVFLNWLGLAAGGALFSTLLYGFSNKYNYRVKRVKLSFDNLPAGFKGLKVVQISDIHSGSFMDKAAVEKGINKILSLNPDLILFTGDLVNDRAIEMAPYTDIFSRLKAPMGVYSVFGNHDYGDYAKWPHEGITQEENLENLKKVHASMGWRLLMNEHVTLERNGDKIALLGIENWSAKARFPKHGRLDLAYKGTDQYAFKILMSHDPSHWDAQVLPNYKDIDLVLSGHTHGMQFGIQVPGFQWSPVQYMYKQWDGLYESEKQKLYVNPGFGFIGYPGRVGILPEITLLEFV